MEEKVGLPSHKTTIGSFLELLVEVGDQKK